MRRRKNLLSQMDAEADRRWGGKAGRMKGSGRRNAGLTPLSPAVQGPDGIKIELSPQKKGGCTWNSEREKHGPPVVVHYEGVFDGSGAPPQSGEKGEDGSLIMEDSTGHVAPRAILQLFSHQKKESKGWGFSRSRRSHIRGPRG